MADVSSNPADRRYTAEHEWIMPDGQDLLVGITSFAQEQLGDIVYVELPKVGDHLDRGAALGVVESVKTASDIYTPVSGRVLEVNPALAQQPELVNDDPYGEGWMVRLAPDDTSEIEQLLSASEYTSQTGG